MKKQVTVIIALLIGCASFSQPAGYYNGTEGKDGEELKAALNDIISGHMQWTYFSSKYTFNYSDADPVNPNNVIMVYTGRSHPNNDYGTGSNQLNREHIWAKSHGNFSDIMPMDGDVHNLKPIDASVNIDKSNKDYDWGEIQHPEATGCYYTDDAWEPRDEVKGDIARIIFYMATRYEGENGEIDLEVVDELNTYPAPEHGKLSTLLEWNLADPPDDFEMNRNNVIYSYQKNRNPFIDNPGFAEMIWNGVAHGPVSIGDLSIVPEEPRENDPVTVSAKVTTSEGSLNKVELRFGNAWNDLPGKLDMNGTGDTYSAVIPGESQGKDVFYRVVATNGQDTSLSPVYHYYIPKVFTGILTSIYDIQGQTSVSPYKGNVVSVSGIVTANFGEGYFIQDGYGEWNGLYIYDGGRNPDIGDSVVITGTVDEFYEKTELKDILEYYYVSSGYSLPEPALIKAEDSGEAYESVLVKIENAACTDANYPANFYMWTVTDETGELLIHNTSVFEYDPAEGRSYTVTGPLNYDYNEWKIEIRFTGDVIESSDVTAPQVVLVEAVTNSNIKVEFSEEVEEVSATSISNYSLNNNVDVVEASLHEFVKSWVFLTVSPMDDGNYELTVGNVADKAGNIMEQAVIPFSFLGLGEHLNGSEVTLYPNPVGETLSISLGNQEGFSGELTIQDLTGKVLRKKNIDLPAGSGNFSTGMSDLGPGAYIVRITSGAGSAARMVLKK